MACVSEGGFSKELSENQRENLALRKEFKEKTGKRRKGKSLRSFFGDFEKNRFQVVCHEGTSQKSCKLTVVIFNIIELFYFA